MLWWRPAQVSLRVRRPRAAISYGFTKEAHRAPETPVHDECPRGSRSRLLHRLCCPAPNRPCSMGEGPRGREEGAEAT
jgi:hypothetical protein